MLTFRTAFWADGDKAHIGIASDTGSQLWFYNATADDGQPLLICFLEHTDAEKAEAALDAGPPPLDLQLLPWKSRSRDCDGTYSCTAGWRSGGQDVHGQAAQLLPADTGPGPARHKGHALGRRPLRTRRYVSPAGAPASVAIPTPVQHAEPHGLCAGYAYFKVGSTPADCRALAEPLGCRVPHLGFAGEATAPGNLGTVLGAWLAGEQEAARVLALHASLPPLSAAEAAVARGGSNFGGRASLSGAQSAATGWAATAAAAPAGAASPSPRPAASGGGGVVRGGRGGADGDGSAPPEDMREKAERRDFIGRGPGPKPEGCTSIFVGNLPYDVRQAAVAEMFGAAGRVIRISVKQGKVPCPPIRAGTPQLVLALLRPPPC